MLLAAAITPIVSPGFNAFGLTIIQPLYARGRGRDRPLGT